MSSHPRSTQDKYVLKNKPQEQTEKNEIRIGAGGITASYIRYAANLYREHKPEEVYTVLIKGSGAAISKACTVAEILRHRIKGLAQIIKITNNEVVDEYLPIEEGLSPVVIKRKLTVIEIKLTTEKLDGKDVLGFQAPLPESEVREFNAPRESGEEPTSGTRRGYRGRGRGGRGGRRGGRGFRGPRGGGRNYSRPHEEGGDYEERRHDHEERGVRSGRGGRGRGYENRGYDRDREDDRGDYREHRSGGGYRDYKDREDYREGGSGGYNRSRGGRTGGYERRDERREERGEERSGSNEHTRYNSRPRGYRGSRGDRGDRGDRGNRGTRGGRGGRGGRGSRGGDRY